MEDRMGLYELIKAVDLCRKKFPDIFLVVVGRGSLKEKLSDLTQTLGLNSHVQFWGYASNEDLPRLYSASDLFVLPTQTLEGFGLVIVEALACGLPIVATPVGAIPEVLGSLGPSALTSGTDPQSLAERICDILSSGLLTPSFRKHCRDFVLENYSWEKAASTFIQKVSPYIRKD